MEALDSIRPFLNNDGGDIELVDVVDNKVMSKTSRQLPRLSYEFFYNEIGCRKYHQTIWHQV